MLILRNIIKKIQNKPFKMILGFDKLKKLVKEKKLLEKLPESELEKKGGASFDLRLGEIYEVLSEGSLGINERKTPETKIIANYEKEKNKKIKLEPGKYYVVKTIEKVNTPKELAFKIIPRSTLFRSGINILGGFGDPGYCGEITLGLVNLNNFPFEIEMGARIANIVFHIIDGEAEEYNGTYQGGKIGSKE
jgi:dCTP deaminase